MATGPQDEEITLSMATAPTMGNNEKWSDKSVSGYPNINCMCKYLHDN